MYILISKMDKLNNDTNNNKFNNEFWMEGIILIDSIVIIFRDKFLSHPDYRSVHITKEYLMNNLSDSQRQEVLEFDKKSNMESILCHVVRILVTLQTTELMSYNDSTKFQYYII